jgi:hypothetical protein
MRHLERRANLRQALLTLLGFHPVAFRGRPYAQRAEQVRRGCARVARLAEDRMQSLAGQVMEDEIYDAPGVESLL